MRKLMSLVLLLAVSVPAWADVGSVPEPGTLSLVALAAGAVAVLARRKK